MHKRKYEHTPSYSTPSQSVARSSRSSSTHNSNKTDRYLNSRKIDYVPGFNISTSAYADNESSSLYSHLCYSDSTLTSNDAPLFRSTSTTCIPSASYRALPTQASRILDAPDILDDYYLNVLAWSDSNLLAVALRNRLYLWNAANGSVSQLLEYPADIITSVSWMKGGSCLAVGDSGHTIKLFDIDKSSEIRSISAHADRVSSLAWNGYVLSSGSRDASIIQHDLRIQNYFVKNQAHTQEVCGLKWNPEGTQLASGGNDNKLCLWELSSTTPQFTANEHTAAVKALAWCPWKANLLATGGGTADKQIKLWNSVTGSCIKSIDSESQVCGLEWNQHDKELLSAHGYSRNQLTLWRYPDMKKINDFMGHSARILCLAQNPEGSMVVSAGADETLRFWSIFESSIVKTSKPTVESPSRGMGYGQR
ncbi:CDC20_2 [Blepharisma stoltei]|uniref:CDC20/Fizzy WD40 domain-containing protein n=1 Tax=Blepharisma stoltei TaxID=1481888 RepID=A0AAU9ISZ1_9CILI|nr:unnamed protein product [Blepharisma stoltei]